MSDSATYILALLGIPGVGRVAAGRLAEHFPDPRSLLECPREQRLLRLKGVARANEIASEIEATLDQRMAAAAAQLGNLTAHEVQPLTPLDPEWPAGLGDLDRSERPVILYSHGHVETLSRRKVGLFASPPLTEDAFGLSQTALRHVLRAGGVPVTGAGNSFDAVVHRVCSSPDHDVPAIFVLSCGLSKMDKSLRKLATASVRSGGLLISSFEMEHGPFGHDEFERAAVQAGLSEVCVFIEPPDGSPEARAMEWALQTGRSVFLIGDAGQTLDAHRIEDQTDFDWLEIATSTAGGNDD